MQNKFLQTFAVITLFTCMTASGTVNASEDNPILQPVDLSGETHYHSCSQKCINTYGKNPSPALDACQKNCHPYK